MPFADATPPDSRPATTTTTTYSTPSSTDLAAVAATVAVVGVLMAILVAWLILRLRNAARSEPNTVPITTRRPASYVFRPSFAPSESSSKFSFARKPLRLSHRRQDGSWDFADPDPFHFKKECLPDFPASPAPLIPASRAHRASSHRDEGTPTDAIDPPPPAYCRESAYPSKCQSLS